MGFLLGLALGAALGAAWGLRALKKRDQLVGSYLAFALHEVNTPITAINMTVLNFINGVFGDVPEDQRRWIEMLRTQTSRLSGICGELRDMVHFELKRDLAMRLEACSLREAFETCMESLRNGIPAAELTIQGEIPAELPAVWADADRLPRTLMSLVFHARKFRSAGPLQLSVKTEGERVALRLEYQGHGISPEEAGRSLDLFYPAHRRKDQLLSAVGLGLGALRVLAARWGGDLRFSVEPGGRSLLELFLAKAKEPVK